MNHFPTITHAFSSQQPKPKLSSEASPPISLSQAELRDIVLAVLG